SGLRAARLARDESDGSAQIGPLASRHDVEPLRGLLTDAIIGRGSSLERAGGRTTHTDEGHRRRLHRAMTQDPTEVLDHAAARLRGIGGTELLIAARPSTEGVVGGKGWELLAVRHGRFAGTVLVPHHADPLAAARSLALTGTGEGDLAAPLCQGHHQETEILLRWLEGPGVRTVLSDGSWSHPARARFDQDHLTRRFARTAMPTEA